MPCISQFYGLSIDVYDSDHAPPRVHARYAGSKASLDIRSGAILHGALPPRALQLVQQWLARNERQVLVSWEQARAGQQPSPVPPLD